MTLADVSLTRRSELARATAQLARAGIDTARIDAEWLLAGMLGGGRFALYLDSGRELSAPVVETYRTLVQRRAAREPLQQILGWTEFRGLRLRVTPDVLVPRPETEVLAEWALERLPSPDARRRPLVIDVGTGSGCLACAIARARSDLDVLAIDVSPVAAVVARANARDLGVSHQVRVIVADLFGGVGALTADAIVANPPYLPSRTLRALPPEVARHEPRLALDGGPDGLAVTRRLIAAASRCLRPAGALLLETAGEDQVAAVGPLMRAAGFAAVVARRDLAGVERFVGGRRAD